MKCEKVISVGSNWKTAEMQSNPGIFLVICNLSMEMVLWTKWNNFWRFLGGDRVHDGPSNYQTSTNMVKNDIYGGHFEN